MCEPYDQSKSESPRPARPVARRWLLLGLAGVACFGCVTLLCAAPAKSFQRTNVNVLVKDAETDQPIYQARLTLRFWEPGGMLKRSKLLTFTAKTNAQGRYRFVDIPKSTVRLIVTAEYHQTFSKEFDVEKDNQVLEVKLKKPQPTL